MDKEAVIVNRLERIRAEEKAYHDRFYAEHRLFEPGSWMSRPVKTVVELAERFRSRKQLDILDLGCGAGRNAIPLAGMLDSGQAHVVCVDLLESALAALAENSRRFGVEERITPIQSAIESFRIEPNTYDMVIAVSALEHVSSEEALEMTLSAVARGTREDGAVCFIIGTNTRETSMVDGRELDPAFEVNVPTARMAAMLELHYRNWTIERHAVHPLEFQIDRGGLPVRLTTDCITFIATREARS